MPQSSKDAQRRREERMRRRTTKLDRFFAFAPEDSAAADSKPKYSRGEAEAAASRALLKLKALPAIVLEAGKPAGPETSKLDDAIDIDPGLASLVLKSGGAEFFNRGKEAPSNLSALIERVGTAGFRNVTMVAAFHSVFDEPLAWYGYGPNGLWWHLVGTAVAAWKIGEAIELNPIAREVLFLAGLLHDIGKPAVQELLGDDSPPADGGAHTVLEAEVRAVSMTHAELVPLILDIWGIEHSLFHLAQHHHAPQRAGDKAAMATIVQLADLVANGAGLGLEREYAFSTPPIERAASKVGIKLPLLGAIRSELGWVVGEIATKVQSADSSG